MSNAVHRFSTTSEFEGPDDPDEARFGEASERGTAFVLVFGASGSGKSSVVKAGLVPDLALPGMVGRIGLVRRQSEIYAEKLRAAGVAVASSRLP